MVRDVVIFGAGGFGRMVCDILRQAGQYRPVAFLDSDSRKHGREVDGLTVAGNLDTFASLRRAGTTGAVVAIGDNATRDRIAGELRMRGAEMISAIHPLASVSPTAILSEHLIIGPRACIGVHARIGRDSVISSGAIIEHDNVIGNAVFIHAAVRLGGTVRVDDFATVGIGASVIHGRRIGRGARVEPGAVVIRDVEAGVAVSGVPAEPVDSTTTVAPSLFECAAVGHTI